MTYSVSQWGPTETAAGEEAAFTVDAATGAVRVAAPLDRERRAAHHLLLTARDAGRPQLLTTAHLFITGMAIASPLNDYHLISINSKLN